MSVLDSFVFLLKADARAAIDDIEDTGEAFDDLKDSGKKATREVAEDVNHMDRVIHGAKDRMIGSFKDMATGFIGLAAAGATLNGMLEQLNQMQERAASADLIGISAGEYQQLEFAFKGVGMEADDMKGILADVNEFAGDDGKVKSWQALGVSVKDANGHTKDASVLISDLAKSVQGLSAADATAKLRALGINDERAIQLLKRGNDELLRQKAIRAQMGLQTEQDTENARQFHQAVAELGTIFDVMGEQLAASLAPALTVVVEGVKAVVQWCQDHKGFLIGFFGALSFVAIPALITSLSGLAVAAWSAMAPFLPFIAVAVALGLAIDDLWTYFSGGDSVIGELADKFPALKQFLADSAKEVTSLIDAFKAFMTDPQVALDGFSADLKAWWAGIISDSQTKIDTLIQRITTGFNNLTEQAKAPFIRLFNWIRELFDHIGNAVSEKIGEGIEKVKGAIKALPGGEKLLNAFSASEDKPATNSPGGPDMAVPGDVNPLNQAAIPAQAANITVGAAAAAPQVPSRTGAPVVNVSAPQVTTGDIHVQSDSADPAKVAAAIPGALDTHLQSSAQHYDDGRSH